MGDRGFSEPGFASASDAAVLAALWQTVFGDTEEEISRFFETVFCPQNTLVIRAGDTVVSMLFLVDMTLSLPSHTDEAYYIYAAATAPAYRRAGLMHALLEFAKKTGRERGKQALLLVPASEALFGFYASAGFREALSYRRGSVSLSLVPDCACTLSLPSYSIYTAARRCASRENGMVVAGEEWFRYLCRGKEKSGEAIFLANPPSYCFYEKQGEALLVPEAVGDFGALWSALREKEPDFREARVQLPVSREEQDAVTQGMVFPLNGEISPCYLGYSYG